MKILKLSATLMLLGGLTLGISATIDEQIAAIQAASAEKRASLVNEFKTTLSTLGEEDRAAAIDQLKSTMQVNGEQLQTKTQTRDRSRVNQMNETQNRQESQKMNQNQVGSQFMQQNPSVTPDAGATPNRFMHKR